MKALRLTLMLLASMLFVPCAAQEEDPNRDNPAVQIPKLKGDTAALNASIRALEATLQRKSEAVGQLMAMCDKKKIKSLKDTLNLLEGYEARIKAQQEVDIVTIIAECERDSSATASKQKSISGEIASLEEELKGLESVRQKMDAQLMQDVQSKWLSKTYSQLDGNALRAAVAQYRQRAAVNKAMNASYQQIQGLLDEFIVYEQGMQAVNEPYHAASVSQLADKVKQLRAKVTGDRRKELSKLFVMLDDYPATVQIFQDLIGEIDKQKTFADIEKVIKAQEEDGEVITSITSIPWLKSQYEAYYNALKNGNGNNTASARVRDVIMKLEP